MRRILRFLGIVGCFGAMLAARGAVADPGLAEDSGAASERPYNREVETVLRKIRSQVGDARYNVKVLDRGDVMAIEGEVDSERSKGRILEAASSATAKRIRDELRIRPGPSDSQIAENVRGALRNDCPQLAGRIQVDVRAGVAYLSGDLRSHREVDELLATALMVEGVTDIKSDITLGGRPYATQRLGHKRY
jgi:osmotically-inducible protein OsmY